MNIHLVLFDMDGVIFEGKNFWLELHRYYGTQDEGVEYFNRYGSDYDRLVKLVAGKLWKGRPASVVQEMADQRLYQPGVEEVFRFLHENSIPSAIISSGPYELAERAQRDLGITMVKANKLRVKNGRIAGKVDVMVPDAEKLRVGHEVMEHFGVHPSHVAFVGDTESDVELARIVGLPVAYDSKSEELIAACKVVLMYGELASLCEVIRRY